MRASPLRSDSLRPLSRRERLVVAAGVAVLLAAAGATYGVLPGLQRWQARERIIAANRDRATRLDALVSGEDELRRAAADERDAGRRVMALLTVGGTPPLAAASLQVLLRQYAQQAGVQLDRVDVAGQPTPDSSGLLALPMTVQGQGDIYGLVGLLDRVQHGGRLLVVDEMAVRRTLVQSSDRLLTWTLRAHGLYPTSPAGR